LKVHFVEHADQVLKLALEPATKATESSKNGSHKVSREKLPRPKTRKASLA
jgi:hypothetical protein